MNVVNLFAYGAALVDRPPLTVWGMALAKVSGFAPAFNIRSPQLGCTHDDALYREPLSAWSTPTGRTSLELGCAVGPEMNGMMMTFGDLELTEEELIAKLDNYWGVVGGPDDRYIRKEVVAKTHSGDVETAFLYVTRPEGTDYVPDLGVDAIANILVHATPREPSTPARGTDALAQMFDALTRNDADAHDLDELVEAVRRRLPEGRWEKGLARS